MKSKNLSWLRLAAAASVSAGVILGGSSVAGAAKPESAAANQAAYWEAQGYGDCEKVVDSNIGSYTVPEGTWSALILKAGSSQSTETPNQVILDPVAGETFTHVSGKGISHVILCSDGGYGGGGGGGAS
jgi:hypothetical protein